MSLNMKVFFLKASLKYIIGAGCFGTHYIVYIVDKNLNDKKAWWQSLSSLLQDLHADVIVKFTNMFIEINEPSSTMFPANCIIELWLDVLSSRSWENFFSNCSNANLYCGSCDSPVWFIVKAPSLLGRGALEWCLSLKRFLPSFPFYNRFSFTIYCMNW